MRILLWAVAAWLSVPAALWCQTPIRLKSGTFDPIARNPLAPPSAASRPAHVLLQFEQPPGFGTVAELKRRGVRVLAPVPDNGLLVSVADPVGMDGLGLRWAGWLTAADKLSPAAEEGTWPGWVVAFHPDVEDELARNLLDSLGFYVLDHPDLLAGHYVAVGGYEQARVAAAYDEVAYILPASTDLVSGQRVTGCSGPVTETGSVAEYVKVGRGWPRVGGQVPLGYWFGTLPYTMPASTVRAEVLRALAEWARYAPLSFSPAGDAAAERTIAIQFFRGPHGDPYPFDGPGKILAHTFYPSPPNAEPVAGDMHLDGDETWTVGGATDLFTVALHEAGHALGLGHSDRPGAVMYPYYRAATALTGDDIAGVRDLYGSRDAGTAPAPPAPPAPPVVPPVQPPAPPAPAPADTVAPSLQITSPASTIHSTQAATITLYGAASDNVAVTAVKWSTSAGASGVATGTTAWTAAGVPLLVGNNTVTVRAYDAAGNAAWRAVTVVRR